jgi:hypothetical protein
MDLFNEKKGGQEAHSPRVLFGYGYYILNFRMP